MGGCVMTVEFGNIVLISIVFARIKWNEIYVLLAMNLLFSFRFVVLENFTSLIYRMPWKSKWNFNRKLMILFDQSILAESINFISFSSSISVNLKSTLTLHSKLTCRMKMRKIISSSTRDLLCMYVVLCM